MFKNKVDTHLRRADYTQMKNVGLSISQWLPCPLAIWTFALDGNLIKSKSYIKMAELFEGQNAQTERSRTCTKRMFPATYICAQNNHKVYVEKKNVATTGTLLLTVNDHGTLGCTLLLLTVNDHGTLGCTLSQHSSPLAALRRLTRRVEGTRHCSC